MSEENKALVRKLYEAVSSGDLEAVTHTALDIGQNGSHAIAMELK